MTLARVTLVAVAALVLGAALVLSSRADNEIALSPDERFAESLCATKIPFEDRLLDVLEGVVHTRATPGKDGWDLLLYHAEVGRFVAREYGREVRQLEVPDTPAGRQVERKELLAFQSQQPAEIMSDAVQRIRRIPPGKMTLVQNIRGLNRLEDDLLFAITGMGPSVFLNPRIVEGLQDAFYTAPSCQPRPQREGHRTG